jgi:hypothetical protein
VRLAAQELAVLGERGSLFYTARALMRLQSLFGAIPIIKGRGVGAAAVKDMLTRMRKELGPAAPPLGTTLLYGVLSYPPHVVTTRLWSPC